MAMGPLAEKVWVAPERVLRVVMPEPPPPTQVLLMAKHPAKRLIPFPVKVEVAVPVLAKAVRERINPAASIAPEVVVDWLTPKPPVKKPLPVIPRA